MDFETVLKFIVTDFSKGEVRYALIGGFAMGALGIMRATVDLDFLVHRDDLNQIEQIMSTHPYRCVYKTDNVSQYVSDLNPFGQIDFIHAFRRISLSMLKRATHIPVYDGNFAIPVLAPEDIIGLKVQSSSNDPLRENLEAADIQLILEHYSSTIDWERLREYFQLFGRENDYEALKKKFT